MTSNGIDVKSRASDADHIEHGGVDKPQAHQVDIQQQHPEMYLEALARYPDDESVDPAEEKRLVRKLDMRILPCSESATSSTTWTRLRCASYAAIFGLKEGLDLQGEEYSWLSSCFYFGWLVWAIPSNLIMQQCPPAYYLAFNILMWGVLLMAQAAAQNFAGLLALRILSGAFEAIADPAFMLITSMYYTRAEQPSRIAAWYIWNGIGVAGGGLIGYGIGHIQGSLASWRYEFIVVGAFCAAWALVLALLLPNSPRTIRGFTHNEKLIMIARMRRNRTGIEQRRVRWGQVREAYLDYKTWLFTLLGFMSNVPNGGISNFSTLVIQGLGFGTLETALLGIPRAPSSSSGSASAPSPTGTCPRTTARWCAPSSCCPPSPARSGSLAPDDAYIGRLICFYLTGSYQASFVLSLSLITSNTGGQSKKMIVSGMIWFGACIGNIASPFFYKSEQAPSYPLGIGSLLVANCIEVVLFFVFRYAFKWENRRKEKQREQLRAAGNDLANDLSAAGFTDLTDKENPYFVYVY
ncbi:major facilitator superfamily domain-containing protein [Apiospora phragmitis]|uniref:Major facilitator superfamily domain-containing protein n=1 Tax=Apiospora phragmitis TaxID=2905665 RepID=A0ABR1TWT7_9PEZI